MTRIQHDSETPAKDQQAITVCAFIHQIMDGEEKVFLPKRAASKKFLPEVYELPGGHIDFNEKPVVGLKREIDEEFRAKIEVGDPFCVFTYSNDIKQSHTIEVVYFAQFVSDPKSVTLNPEDHSEYDWLSEDELKNAATTTKGLDDAEFIAIRKGFALLRGESPKF